MTQKGPKIGWVTRLPKIEPGSRGWAYAKSPRSLPEGLQEYTGITVVAFKDGQYVVVDAHQKNWVLNGEQMDFPREYRYECPWLPENDPRVLKQIEHQVDKMRASPYDRDSAGRSHYHEKLEYLEWLLNRNGVLQPQESDDQPK